MLRSEVVGAIRAARDDVDGNLLVEGSARLVQALARNDLVDEYRLMVFPVILGSGKRLFPDGMPAPAKLTLEGADTTGDGVLLLRYQKPS